MAITYSEFDTTPAGLIAALKAAILTNADWTDYGVVNVTTTSTNATTSSGTTVNLTSVAGFAVGQWITVQPGASEITRQITNITGNTITVSTTWGAIYATGTTYKTRGTVLKSTTTGGAKLIVDLEGGTNGLSYTGVSVYRDWTTGTTPGGHTDYKSYYVYYRASSGVSTMPLHVTLSVGKDHLFFSIEGPRAGEASPTSTTYGSIKNYFAISELTPYHAADTVPAVVAVGINELSVTPAVTTGGHQVAISRNKADTFSWQPGRLGTLFWPTVYTTDVIKLNRDCTIDGSTYLLPYVLFSEDEGIRGRLKHFFYAGTTDPSPAADMPSPVGSKVSYDGIVYKLVAPSKGDGSNVAWGPFGSASNSSTTPLRSLVLAVPYSVA